MKCPPVIQPEVDERGGGAKPSRTCTAALARVCGKCHKNVWSSFLDVSVGKHHVCRLAAQFPFWKVGLSFSK